METIIIKEYRSPIGDMLLGSIGSYLCLCDWKAQKHRSSTDKSLARNLNAKFERGSSETIENAIDQLEEYFHADRQTFKMPLIFAGTKFQQRVWRQLRAIPYGKTISYSEISSRISTIKAVRAVAMAIASNPISIFVPCHRVIGKDNTLTGYAGGLSTKWALLMLERHMTPITSEPLMLIP